MNRQLKQAACPWRGSHRRRVHGDLGLTPPLVHQLMEVFRFGKAVGRPL